MPILTTPGVIGILGAGKTPVPVDIEEIDPPFRSCRAAMASSPRRI
jgi:transcription antitermination factor NusG